MRYLPFFLVLPLILALFFLPDRGRLRFDKDAGGRPVIGMIESTQPAADGSLEIAGWACRKASDESVNIALFAKNEELARGTANLTNNPFVSEQCQTPLGQHRFQINVPASIALAHSGEPITVRSVPGEPPFQIAISDREELKLP